jgi:hypothetical protein
MNGPPSTRKSGKRFMPRMVINWPAAICRGNEAEPGIRMLPRNFEIHSGVSHVMLKAMKLDRRVTRTWRSFALAASALALALAEPACSSSSDATGSPATEASTGTGFPAAALSTFSSASKALSIELRTSPEQPPHVGPGASAQFRIMDSAGAPATGLVVSVTTFMPVMRHLRRVADRPEHARGLRAHLVDRVTHGGRRDERRQSHEPAVHRRSVSVTLRARALTDAKRCRRSARACPSNRRSKRPSSRPTTRPRASPSYRRPKASTRYRRSGAPCP